jgi:FkbH-like protein
MAAAEWNGYDGRMAQPSSPSPHKLGQVGTLYAVIEEGVIRPGVTALLLVWLCRRTQLADAPVHVWVTLAPLLYVIWLILHLALCALDAAVLAKWVKKPRRFQEGVDDPKIGRHFLLCLKMYLRYALIQSLPMVTFLMRAMWVRNLVFRAYAPSFDCHYSAVLSRQITDPELTFIDQDVIVGDEARLVAHNVARTPDGLVLFQSAPIRLERGCIIGGGSLIELGVVVGRYSIVESCSHVRAFTQIPPGQVWGGNPAVYRRDREDMPAARPPVEAPAAVMAPQETLSLIARALGLPEEKVTAASTSKDFPEWDSLGMMSIAAALHSRHGVQLEAERVFALNSVAAVIEAVGRMQKREAERPAAEVVDAELLPLQNLAEATAGLAAAPGAVTAARTVQVRIAATFVAQPLEDALRLWTRAFGIESVVRFADFNQVAQTLLSPGGLFDQPAAGFHVVLARPEDFPGGKEQAEAVLSAVRAHAARTKSMLLVADLPPALRGGGGAEVDELRRWWREQLSGIAGVRVLGFTALVEELGLEAATDARMEAAASAPFSPALYQRLGIALAREVRAFCLPPKKVIAVDADGTLWDGIVGEDGVEAVSVGASHRALQERLAALRARGVLLVLLSKNAEQDVRRVLAEKPAMLLKEADFAAMRVNWLPKPDNLRAIAAELGLGLDAFVFLDDNPVEKLEVAAHCPSVTILPGEPQSFAGALDRLWCFDGAGSTREDAARAAFQQQNAVREAVRGTLGDLQAYLRSLELVVEVRRALPDELPRLSQLSLKTNQFNTSLRRHSLPEIQALASTHELWSVSARDKFGDYGLVGAVVGTSGQTGCYEICDLFLSCRALGRGVEDALLHVLAAHARQAGARCLGAVFNAGPRNEPALLFLRRHGFQEAAGGRHEIQLDGVPGAPAHVRLLA